MSLLRANWSKRLEAAQLDSSWQAQLEAKVLRFLLARYEGSIEAAPVPGHSLYQGQPPEGLMRAPRDPVSRSRTLRRIQRNAHTEPLQLSPLERSIDKAAYRDVQRHQGGIRNTVLSGAAKEIFPQARWLHKDLTPTLTRFMALLRRYD